MWSCSSTTRLWRTASMHWSWTASQSRPTFSWASVTLNWRTLMRPSAICRKVRRKDGKSLQNYHWPGFLVVYSLFIMPNPCQWCQSFNANTCAILISVCLTKITVLKQSLSFVCLLALVPCVKPVLLRCCFCFQLIIWQKSSGWTLEMTSPALCALPRRNVGIASKISASTKRTSYMLTWPNLFWPRRKGEASAGVQHRLDKHQLGHKSCCHLYSHRELEEYKEKQDDNQNGGDAGKISSRHVCFWMRQFV